MMQRLHLHNCPSKAISGDTKKIPQRKLVWQSPFYYSHQSDKFYGVWYFVQSKVWLRSEPKPLSPQRERPDAFLLCGFRCHKRLGWWESPVHPPDEDLAVSYRTSASKNYNNEKKNCRKETKKSSSITTLINTKGYPILYTVVCDIRGPYKMLSLSLDFVLILSWCIKY